MEGFAAAGPSRGTALVRWLVALAAVLAAELAMVPAAAAERPAAPLAGAGLRLITENDFLADDDDDLYSFGLGLEVARPPWIWVLRESGFTDRDAGIRFDETSLSVGRPLLLPGGWQGWGEIGITRTGEGLLGQRVQNELHRLIGSDEVDLAYLPGERWHGGLALTLARPTRVPGRPITLSPYLEVAAIPGLKAHALLAAHAAWRPDGPLAVTVLLGGRSSEATYAPLEPWMGGFDLQAEVALVYRQRVVLAWSTNAFGTGQDHLTLGYRVGTGRPASLREGG